MFVVHFGINKNNEDKLFIVNCVKYTITTNLTLTIKDDDFGQTITYSKKELKKRKFKLSDIVKIMKAIDKNKISLGLSFVSISSDVINN